MGWWEEDPEKKIAQHLGAGSHHPRIKSLEFGNVILTFNFSLVLNHINFEKATCLYCTRRMKERKGVVIRRPTI